MGWDDAVVPRAEAPRAGLSLTTAAEECGVKPEVLMRWVSEGCGTQPDYVAGHPLFALYYPEVFRAAGCPKLPGTYAVTVLPARRVLSKQQARNAKARHRRAAGKTNAQAAASAAKKGSAT